MDPGKDPVRILQEAGWVSGPIWTGVKNPTRTGICSPDVPVCSESLYLLSYPGHVFVFVSSLFFSKTVRFV